MTTKLIVISGVDTGREYEFRGDELVLIGRGADCNLSLTDGRVSRIHCRVFHGAESTRFWDAGSLTGTRVNGVKQAEGQIRNGDVLSLGRTKIRFQSRSAVAGENGGEVYRIKSVNDDVPYDFPQFERRIVVHSRRMKSVAPPEVETAAMDNEFRPKRENRRRTMPETNDLMKLAGTTLHHYEIGDVMGESPEGLRFYAIDRRHERKVIVKILWPDSLRPHDVSQQFVEIMKRSVPIRHENLLSIFDAGTTGSYLWTVSEYAPGESLSHIIEQVNLGRAVPWEQAFRMTLHVARALDVVNSKQLVHGDVSPARVLFQASNQIAKLTDLGLPEALALLDPPATTACDQAGDNLPFLAPEETRDDEPRDCRTDLYRLGAIVYAVLTGRPPVSTGSREETIERIQQQIPKPVSKRHKSVPPLFAATVMQMLAKKPADRFETPTYLVGDMERVARYLKYQHLL